MKIVYENEDVGLIPNVISFRRKHINYNDPKRFKSKMIYNSTSQSIIIGSFHMKSTNASHMTLSDFLLILLKW